MLKTELHEEEVVGLEMWEWITSHHVTVSFYSEQVVVNCACLVAKLAGVAQKNLQMRTQSTQQSLI